MLLWLIFFAVTVTLMTYSVRSKARFLAQLWQSRNEVVCITSKTFVDVQAVKLELITPWLCPTAIPQLLIQLHSLSFSC
uniref:Putative secreted protein n=1 Tax=Amblyomma triste TaxID=251400 RepID=A0A023G0U1_AMBTT